MKACCAVEEQCGLHEALEPRKKCPLGQSQGALQPISLICILLLTALAEEVANAVNGSAAAMLADSPDGQNIIQSFPPPQSIKLTRVDPDIPSVSSCVVSSGNPLLAAGSTN